MVDIGVNNMCKKFDKKRPEVYFHHLVHIFGHLRYVTDSGGSLRY